jgi:5-(carboxyamino)imidazole ribonucleotide synthase
MSNQSATSTGIKQVGVIGGGQLAWMMAAGAKSLGIKLVVQTPDVTDPAVAIAAETILAPIEDATATARLADRCDVITFENEFINLEALSGLAQKGVCFRPSLSTLAALLDKYHQRSYLQHLGLPVPKFASFNPESSVDLGLRFPFVLKARRHGYDGQGTFIVKDTEELQRVLQRFRTRHQNLADAFLVEEFVPFERELAVIAARSLQGKLVMYPIVETQQEQQVCRRVIAPADLSPAVITEMEAITHTLLESLQAVGIFGIELFLTPAGKILINEIAPRTHNSGHFTLDACKTSQFEQHLRAVCNFPLGSPALHSQGALMVNLLGLEHSQVDYLAKRQQLAEIPHTFIHWYGKTALRPGRKLGHVTVLLNSPARNHALEIARTVEAIWYEDQSKQK